jgi:hypothetical protein
MVSAFFLFQFALINNNQSIHNRDSLPVDVAQSVDVSGSAHFLQQLRFELL